MKQHFAHVFRSTRKPLLAAVAFVVAAWFIPFSAWSAVGTELSIFFGLLAAALPQAMALTAQVHPTVALNPSDTEKLVDRLERQQTYWFALFVLCGAGIVFLIIGKVLANDSIFGADVTLRFSRVSLPWFTIPDVKCAQFLSGAIGAVCTLLATHIVGIGRGVVSLQRLRSRFIRDGAKDAEHREVQIEDAPATPYKPDPSFGEVIKSNPGSARRKAS